MKVKHRYIYLFVIITFFCILFFCCHFKSSSATPNTAHTDDAHWNKTNESTSEAYNTRISERTKIRHVKPKESKPNSNDERPEIELISQDGELNENNLKSLGLNKSQIDGVKGVFNEISESIFEHFMKNSREEQTNDGSFIYVLDGDANFSSNLQEKMKSRLIEAIGSAPSNLKLANQITEETKNRALLNFGADDMIGAAFRDLNKDGTGWEDGIRINGVMPGMIEHYRKNGWPSGTNIHESNGKAIFHPLKSMR